MRPWIKWFVLTLLAGLAIAVTGPVYRWGVILALWQPLRRPQGVSKNARYVSLIEIGANPYEASKAMLTPFQHRFIVDQPPRRLPNHDTRTFVHDRIAEGGTLDDLLLTNNNTFAARIEAAPKRRYSLLRARSFEALSCRAPTHVQRRPRAARFRIRSPTPKSHGGAASDITTLFSRTPSFGAEMRTRSPTL